MAKTQILSSLEVAGQFPLDTKLYTLTIADLIDLGVDNLKAFSYYENMRVDCAEDGLQYKWVEEGAEEGAEVAAAE